MSAADAAALVLAAAVLGAIACVQVMGAAGRPVGHLLWGGRHEVLPRALRIGSALSVPLYAAMVGVLLLRAGGTGEPGDAVRVGTWVLVGYFAVGIVLNAASRSRPERLAMTPACAVLTVCCLVVATE